MKVEQLIAIGVALSCEKRLRVLNLVRAHPVVLFRVSRVLNLAYATVVDHVKRLEAAGLVEPKPWGKTGKRRVYAPTPLCNSLDFGDEVTPWNLRGK